MASAWQSSTRRSRLRDRTIRGFLDGALVQERTLPRVDRVLALARRDDTSGDVILKVVNSAPEAQTLNVRLAGVAQLAEGTVTVLTSADPLDENTFEEPTKIVPKRSIVKVGAGMFTHAFPAYSLSILRIPSK